MATALSDRFAWKSNYSGKYLKRLDEGILAFTDDDSKTIFKREDPKDPKNSELVNIMHSDASLYLEGVRSGEKTEIRATAHKTNTNPHDQKCTLLKPTFIPDKPLVFRCIHVHSSCYLKPDEDGFLYAVSPETDPDEKDLFTAVGPQ